MSMFTIFSFADMEALLVAFFKEALLSPSNVPVRVATQITPAGYPRPPVELIVRVDGVLQRQRNVREVDVSVHLFIQDNESFNSYALANTLIAEINEILPLINRLTPSVASTFGFISNVIISDNKSEQVRSASFTALQHGSPKTLTLTPNI